MDTNTALVLNILIFFSALTLMVVATSWAHAWSDRGRKSKPKQAPVVSNTPMYTYETTTQPKTDVK